MESGHDRGLQPSLRRDEDAGEPRVVVDDVKSPAADRLVGAIQKKRLARKVVPGAELLGPALGSKGQRLERPFGPLPADDRHLVAAARKLATEVEGHELDAAVAVRGHGVPRADDKSDPPQSHMDRTRGALAGDSNAVPATSTRVAGWAACERRRSRVSAREITCER